MFRESKTLKENYNSSNGNLHLNSNNSLNINTSHNNNNNSNNNTNSTNSTTKHNTTKTHQLFHNYNFKQIHLSNSINIFKPNNNNNNDTTKTKINKITSSKSPTNQKMTKSNTIVYKTLTNPKTNLNTPQKTAIPFNTITDLKLSYNKQMMEKDLKIEKLQRELKYYKSQYMKLHRHYTHHSNKQFSPIKTPFLNKSIPRKRSNNDNFYMHTTIQQPMKNSFEFNGNQSYIKKQHERELSERINNFYTPKANELIRNFNVKKHRSSLKHNHIQKGINIQNSISSLSKNKKVNSYSKKSLTNNTTNNNNRNGKKDLLTMTIPSEYLSQMIGLVGNNKNTCESSKTNKNNSLITTTSSTNYTDSLNGIIKRMNKIVYTLFSFKEK